MEFARLVALVAGIAIVVLTVWSVFTSLVVPRATSSRLLGIPARILSALARQILPRLPNFESRDRMLSLVGPAAVVSLFILWLFLILLSLALVIWWNSGVDFPDALGISGSSLFTLGAVTAPGAGPRILEIVAAGLGFGVIALEIAYLPALYSAFATRETEVTLLAARAGTPAWGPEILARHFWLDTMDELPPLYSDWERWASAVSESHANYPGLVWFRSPVSTRSWLVALGRHDGLRGPVPLRQPGADAAPGPALPLHGDQVHAVHGECVAHPLRDRSAPHVGHPAQQIGIRRRLSPARGGPLPDGARG